MLDVIIEGFLKAAKYCLHVDGYGQRRQDAAGIGAPIGRCL